MKIAFAWLSDTLVKPVTGRLLKLKQYQKSEWKENETLLFSQPYLIYKKSFYLLSALKISSSHSPSCTSSAKLFTEVLFLKKDLHLQGISSVLYLYFLLVCTPLPDFDIKHRIYNFGFLSGREKCTDLTFKAWRNKMKLSNGSYR